MLFFLVSVCVIVIVGEHKEQESELKIISSILRSDVMLMTMMMMMMITLDVLSELLAIPLSHSSLIKSFCPRAQFSAQSI